jgi:hypothetical protein
MLTLGRLHPKCSLSHEWREIVLHLGKIRIVRQGTLDAQGQDLRELR